MINLFPISRVAQYLGWPKSDRKNRTINLPLTRVAVLTDPQSQLVLNRFKNYGALGTVSFQVLDGGAGKVDQLVFDLSSALYQFKPEFIVVLLSAEHLQKEFCSQDNQECSMLCTMQLEYIHALYKSIVSHLQARVIFTTYIEPKAPLAGMTESKSRYFLRKELEELNMLLRERYSEYSDLVVVNVKSLLSTEVFSHHPDGKMYIHSDHVLSLCADCLEAGKMFEMKQIVNPGQTKLQLSKYSFKSLNIERRAAS